MDSSSPADILETQNLIRPDRRPYFVKYLKLQSTNVHPQVIDAFDLDLALTCLFSATKIEETVKKSREYLAFALKLVRGSDVDYEDLDHPDLTEYRRFMIHFEREILHVCSFRFDVVHPHRLMLKVIKKMGFDADFGAIYVTARILRTFNPKQHKIDGTLWVEHFKSTVEDTLEVARQLSLILSTREEAGMSVDVHAAGEYKDMLIEFNELIDDMRTQSSIQSRAASTRRNSNASSGPTGELVESSWDKNVKRFEEMAASRKNSGDTTSSSGHRQQGQRSGSHYNNSRNDLRYQDEREDKYRRHSRHHDNYDSKNNNSRHHLNERKYDRGGEDDRRHSSHQHSSKRDSTYDDRYGRDSGGKYSDDRHSSRRDRRSRSRSPPSNQKYKFEASSSDISTKQRDDRKQQPSVLVYRRSPERDYGSGGGNHRSSSSSRYSNARDKERRRSPEDSSRKRSSYRSPERRDRDRDRDRSDRYSAANADDYDDDAKMRRWKRRSRSRSGERDRGGSSGGKRKDRSRSSSRGRERRKSRERDYKDGNYSKNSSSGSARKRSRSRDRSNRGHSSSERIDRHHYSSNKYR